MEAGKGIQHEGTPSTLVLYTRRQDHEKLRNFGNHLAAQIETSDGVENSSPEGPNVLTVRDCMNASGYRKVGAYSELGTYKQAVCMLDLMHF